MKKLNFLPALIFGLGALTTPQVNAARSGVNAAFLADDFFIAAPEAPIFQNTLRPQPVALTPPDCRARISQILCLVEPMTDENIPRKCISEDLSVSATALQNIYDVLPAQLAVNFCKLAVIYVERNFLGTAYAGSSPGDNSKTIMGIRESALKGGFALKKWISWKEQLSFGGNPTGYESREDLVKVNGEIHFPNGANDFLFFVIAHEFGHLIDFAHKVNDFECSSDPNSTLPCPAKPGSWSALSWNSLSDKYTPTVDDPWGLGAWSVNNLGQFKYREELCFYACAKDHGSPEKMSELYSTLHTSNLLTTYSATNAFDDFAEATAFWAMAKYAGTYEVQLPSGEKYDLVQKFARSEAYRAKREWLEALYANLPRAAALTK